jgi:hypothetical protein
MFIRFSQFTNFQDEIDKGSVVGRNAMVGPDFILNLVDDSFFLTFFIDDTQLTIHQIVFLSFSGATNGKETVVDRLENIRPVLVTFDSTTKSKMVHQARKQSYLPFE